MVHHSKIVSPAKEAWFEGDSVEKRRLFSFFPIKCPKMTKKVF